MWVLTADQHASTRRGDRVEDLLAGLAPWQEEHADAVVRPLERTVGDEVQVLLDDPGAAVDLALELMRRRDWAVGIGAGPVTELGPSARASSGPAFVHARAAVERARGRAVPAPVVVAGTDEAAAADATALLQLLAAVVRRRSAAGWEVAELLAPGARQKDVAARLGISEQAVSQRARSALLAEERGARPLAARLLAAAGGGPATRGAAGAAR
ncbi:hypothetical protein MF406_09320 [Georgenia sp. TF02-10]|uniref:hypothetical protein n=1 Tax=Georgenia sp. TF02-10 TaxID=2917725 RepID=UPI001FA6BC17|nr:hypothetical protein [Georgenia sp. TF02-10]UNX53231.1 hypothetical protein MF406_09320 [Georgenia sp. TF02-10]